MTLEAVFAMASTLAFFAWIGLFIFYAQSWIYSTLFSGVLILLGGTYIFYLIYGISSGDMEGAGFGSLAEVKALMSSDEALLAGWIHYLAFDLFVGMWIAHDAWKKDISRWLMLPALLGTFMAGPLGLMLYFIIRAGKTGKLVQSTID